MRSFSSRGPLPPLRTLGAMQTVMLRGTLNHRLEPRAREGAICKVPHGTGACVMERSRRLPCVLALAVWTWALCRCAVKLDL